MLVMAGLGLLPLNKNNKTLHEDYVAHMLPEHILLGLSMGPRPL